VPRYAAAGWTANLGSVAGTRSRRPMN